MKSIFLDFAICQSIFLEAVRPQGALPDTIQFEAARFLMSFTALGLSILSQIKVTLPF